MIRTTTATAIVGVILALGAIPAGADVRDLAAANPGTIRAINNY